MSKHQSHNYPVQLIEISNNIPQYYSRYSRMSHDV